MGLFQEQYIVDEKGQKIAVILPVLEYEKLLEGLHDLVVIAERRDEPAITFEELNEKLKLVARIYEQLSTEATVGKADRAKQARLQLAEELLAEVNDIEDDSQGEFDAVQDIWKIRKERGRELCQRSV